MVQQDLEKQLSSVLERIVFDNTELSQLKEVLTNFTQGMITPKALKQNILQCRARIMRDLMDYFVLYIESLEKPKTSVNNGNGVVEKLQVELKEKNSLLENLARRIVDLELQFKEQFDELDINTEEEIVHETPLGVNNNQIQELLSILYDSQGNTIKDEYRFIQYFTTLIKNWNEAQFGNLKGKTLADIIVEFQFPQSLEIELVKVGSIRNNISHDIYEVKEEEYITVYRAYFLLLIYLLIKSSSNPKEIINNKAKSIKALHNFISENVQDEELKNIAINTVQSFFP